MNEQDIAENNRISTRCDNRILLMTSMWVSA